MLLKENFYKRRNEKAWSLRLLTLVFLSCFVFSAQSFAKPSAITTEQSSAITTEKEDSFQVRLLKFFIEKGEDAKVSEVMLKLISRPNWQDDPDNLDFMKIFIEKADGKYLWHVVQFVPKSYLNKHPELLKALIANGDQELLMDIVGRHAFDPQNKVHYDLVKALIAKGDNKVLTEIALVILVEPEWQEYPELKDYLIERLAGLPSIEKVNQKALKNLIKCCLKDLNELLLSLPPAELS